MLTSGVRFPIGVPYTTAPQCTVFELGAWTEKQTDGSQHHLMTSNVGGDITW